VKLSFQSEVANRGRNKGAKGYNSPGGESLWGRRITMGAPNHCGWRRNVSTSTFFNTVLKLLKDLRFEHGGAKLASYPGRHLTLLRPWSLS